MEDDRALNEWRRTHEALGLDRDGFKLALAIKGELNPRTLTLRAHRPMTAEDGNQLFEGDAILCIAYLPCHRTQESLDNLGGLRGATSRYRPRRDDKAGDQCTPNEWLRESLHGGQKDRAAISAARLSYS